MGDDIFVQVRHSHDRMAGLLTAASGARRRRSRLLAQLAREVDLHRAAEEQVLYPALAARTTVAAGQVDRGRREHEALAALVRQLDQAAAAATGRDGFAALLAPARQQLAEHVREAEVLLRTAAASLDPGELDRLAEAFRRIRAAAQRAGGTGPAPDRLPVRLAVAALVAWRVLGRR